MARAGTPTGLVYGQPGTPEYKAYQAEWRKRKRRNNPAFAKEETRKAREYQLKNPVKHALGLYKRSAIYKGIERTMSDERLVQLLKQDCSYCGAVAAPLNGVDRIDNSRGYVENNVTTACRTCNLAKREMSLEEFKAWVGRAAKHMGV